MYFLYLLFLFLKKFIHFLFIDRSSCCRGIFCLIWLLIQNMKVFFTLFFYLLWRLGTFSHYFFLAFWNLLSFWRLFFIFIWQIFMRIYQLIHLTSFCEMRTHYLLIYYWRKNSLFKYKYCIKEKWNYVYCSEFLINIYFPVYFISIIFEFKFKLLHNF